VSCSGSTRLPRVVAERGHELLGDVSRPGVVGERHGRAGSQESRSLPGVQQVYGDQGVRGVPAGLADDLQARRWQVLDHEQVWLFHDQGADCVRTVRDAGDDVHPPARQSASCVRHNASRCISNARQVLSAQSGPPLRPSCTWARSSMRSCVTRRVFPCRVASRRSSGCAPPGVGSPPGEGLPWSCTHASIDWSCSMISSTDVRGVHPTGPILCPPFCSSPGRRSRPDRPADRAGSPPRASTAVD